LAGKDDKLLTELAAFLEVFKTAFLELEATKTPTLQLALPWFYKLNSHCDVSATDSVEIASLKTTAISLIDSKFIMQPLHNLAAALNPKMRNLKMVPDATKVVIYSTIRKMVELVNVTCIK